MKGVIKIYRRLCLAEQKELKENWNRNKLLPGDRSCNFDALSVCSSRGPIALESTSKMEIELMWF